MSFLTQSHQVFFGCPLGLIPSTSHVIQCLTQSLSSFHSTCPNHLNLLLLIIKLTGSNPKSSLSSLLFFLSLSLTPHIHLIILISVRFIFKSCSTFMGQVSLPYIRQLLTQVAYTLPFSFNKNPFPVRMGRYSWNFFEADLTLVVTAHSFTDNSRYIYTVNRSVSLSVTERRKPIKSMSNRNRIKIFIELLSLWIVHLTFSVGHYEETSFGLSVILVCIN